MIRQLKATNALAVEVAQDTTHLKFHLYRRLYIQVGQWLQVTARVERSCGSDTGHDGIIGICFHTMTAIIKSCIQRTRK